MVFSFHTRFRCSFKESDRVVVFGDRVLLVHVGRLMEVLVELGVDHYFLPPVLGGDFVRVDVSGGV